MPIKLSTLIDKVHNLPIKENTELINHFHNFMKNNSSERHIINNIKVVLNFDNYFHPPKILSEANKKDIYNFLDSKIKPIEIDPDKKWNTTWNHYLNHLKFFFRWLYNTKAKKDENTRNVSEWVTPDFLRIKMKRTNRLSPYSQNDIWDREELLTIINYEPSKRNKAALSLFWDLDARNHEVTLLKIKNIRLREKYGEGEVPRGKDRDRSDTIDAFFSVCERLAQ